MTSPGGDVAHHDHHDHDHHDHGRGGWVGALFHIFLPHSHDTSDSIDDALEASSQGIRAVKLSLAALALTAVVQLAVMLVSGSVALLADTIHNFSDALTAIPLWVAFVLSRRHPTRRYTYGYGRAEDLAGLFIIVMIAASAALAGWQSVLRLATPQRVEHLPWVLAAGLVGFLGNELVAVYRIRIGRRIGSASLVADGVHARTDGFTSLAVVVGVVGVWLGFPQADAIVGLLITVTIVVVLVGSVRDIGRRLMDGVDPELVSAAEAALAGVLGVAEVRSVQMRWNGHRLHVRGIVGVEPHLNVVQTEQLSHAADQALRSGVPNVGRVDVSAVAATVPEG